MSRILVMAALIAVGARPSLFGQPAPLTAPQLDQLVARIALYPDPLLAQVMTASTYWNEIPDAAAWADQHSYLTADELAQAIQDDHLPWEPSVLALLPFPSVLDMMASDAAWTEQLGNAVLTQHAEVMDAVQRMRKKAKDYGYLQPNPYLNVSSSAGYIEILPADPGLIYVPEYDPFVVFSRPAQDVVIRGAIRFGPGIAIGAAFAPFGWIHERAFVWPSHTILIDRRPWARTWVNRERYVHPYTARRIVGPRAEHHELRGRLHR
jgi:Protein of unknown function (DUF3300)